MDRTFSANFVAEFLIDLPMGEPDFSFTLGGAPGGVRVSVQVMGEWGSWWADIDLVEGSSLLSRLFTTPDPNILLSVVGGRPILVPVRDPARWKRLGDVSEVRLARPVAELGLIVMVTDLSVVAVSDRGVHWDTRRLALTDLVVNEICDARLVGLADEGTQEERIVEVDFVAGHVTGPVVPWMRALPGR